MKTFEYYIYLIGNILKVDLIIIIHKQKISKRKIYVLFFIMISFIGCTSLKTNSAIVPTNRLQLKWWKQRHEAIINKVNANPQLILIGDSILHLLDHSDRDSVRAKYLDKYNTINMGFSGDRTENVIWRLQNGELANINPKVALLLIGTNNTDGNNFPTINYPDELEEAIWKICKIIEEKLPNTEILLLGIFPFGRNIPNFRNTLILKTNKLISGFPSRDKHIHYMDIRNIFLDKDGKIIKEIMPDYLHPNAKGHMLMFDKLDGEITKLMKK